MTSLPLTSHSPVGVRYRCTVLGNSMALARRELRDSLGSRWFLLYTIGFAVLAVAISFMSLAGAGSQGFAGFGRTTAGLLNLVMLVVPLMAIMAGAGSIASERERGSLLYLCAQPVSRLEILLGKFLGLGVALCMSLFLGFGLSAAALTWQAGGSGAGAFLVLVGMTCLLCLVLLSVGLLISVVSRKSSVSTGIALFLWLCLVILSDLGLMAGAIVFRLRVQELFAIAIVNPLQSFKLSVVLGMNGSLDVMGPVGSYASQAYGTTLLQWILPAVLVAWCVAALAAASFVFSRRSPV